jgi:hypothetical protein
MAKPQDYTMHVGKTYGNLTVLEIKRLQKKVVAECLCSCGNHTSSTALARLVSGKITSCKACSSKVNAAKGRESRTASSKYNYLIGTKVNYFTVLRRADIAQKEPSGTFQCRCICGNIRFLDAHTLTKSQDNKSCGCQQSRLLSLAAGGTGIVKESTTLNDLIRKSHEYAKWTNACLAHANYTCFISGKHGVAFNVHHLLPLGQIISLYGITRHNWRLHKEKLFDISNGIVLTEEIHQELHKLYGKYPTIDNIIAFKQQYVNSLPVNT